MFERVDLDVEGNTTAVVQVRDALDRLAVGARGGRTGARRRAGLRNVRRGVRVRARRLLVRANHEVLVHVEDKHEGVAVDQGEIRGRGVLTRIHVGRVVGLGELLGDDLAGARRELALHVRSGLRGLDVVGQGPLGLQEVGERVRKNGLERVEHLVAEQLRERLAAILGAIDDGLHNARKLRTGAVRPVDRKRRAAAVKGKRGNEGIAIDLDVIAIIVRNRDGDLLERRQGGVAGDIQCADDRAHEDVRRAALDSDSRGSGQGGESVHRGRRRGSGNRRGHCYTYTEESIPLFRIFKGYTIF